MKLISIKSALESEATNGFITRKGIAKALGYKDSHSVRRYIDELERLPGGLYHTDDVADEIFRQIERKGSYGYSSKG